MSSAKSSSSGFTLLEVTGAVAIFALFFTALWQLFDNTAAAVQYNLHAAALDGALRRVSERVAEELKDSGESDDGTNHVASHPPTVATTSSTLTFQRRIAFTGDPSDWGSPITYSLAAAAGENAGNGVDDDKDGIVDEQRVVRTQDGATVVIADGVTGLTASRSAGEYKMDIVVTAARVLKQAESPVTRSTTTTVALRNKP